MSANEGSSRSSNSGGLFQACITVSGLVLGVSWLFGLVPPMWLIHVANPIGWIASRIGLTSLKPGLFSAAELAARTPGGWIGIPIVGAFVVMSVIVTGSRRYPVLSFLNGVLAMIVLQFLMQDGLLSIAERARSKQAEAPTDLELVWTEARALAMALDISKLTGAPGVGYEADAFAPAARLYDLAAKVDLSDIVAPPPAFEVSSGNVVLRFETVAPAFPLSTTGARSAHLTAFEQKMASLGHRIDFSAVRSMNVMEPAVTLAMVAAFNIALMAPNLAKLDPELAAAMFSASSKVTIRLASVDTTHRNAHTTSESGDVWANYDPANKTISISVEHTRYAKGMIAMLDRSIRVGGEALSVDDQVMQHWGEDFTTPLTHELWHALVANVPGWADMPAAYDEGLATAFQNLTERLTSATIQHHAYSEAAMTPEANAKVAEAMRTTASTTERSYLDRLAKAASEGRLVPVRELFLLRNRFYDTDKDTLLLRYAEAWSVAMRLIASPKLRETTFRALKKIEHREDLEADEIAAWTTLDHDLVTFPREILEGMANGHP